MFKKTSLVCWALLLPVFVTAQPVTQLKQPNILLLVAEDMSSHVGAFGDKVAITPTLDQLASEGVRYNNVFTTAGVCSPSRAALITGVHQMTLGAHHMRTSSFKESEYRSVPPAQVKAFPEILRQNGYYTYTDKKLDYQFSGSTSNSGPFTIWNDEGFNTSWSNRESQQPFFGMVNFMVTHESGIFSRDSWPKSLMHFGFQLFQGYFHLGHSDVISPEQVEVPPYYPDTLVVRKDIASHFNNINIMDRQVGEILGQLKADGLADSTIVIWTTDHGDGLPRAKREVFDSGIKVPMIIRWPKNYRPKGVSDGGWDKRMVSFVDLAPTILKLANIDAPNYMQGSVFAGKEKDQARDYIFAAKDRMIEVFDRQRAVRDERFKYIRNYLPEKAGAQPLSFRDTQDIMLELWRAKEAGELNDAQKLWFQPRQKDELYDTLQDPHELNNLANNSAFTQPLQRLSSALDDWLKQVPDLGSVPEIEMAQKFWPAGIQPITQLPSVHRTSNAQLELVGSAGASVGYRINEGPWQVYKVPFTVTKHEKVEVKAIRYGWQESPVLLVEGVKIEKQESI